MNLPETKNHFKIFEGFDYNYTKLKQNFFYKE